MMNKVTQIQIDIWMNDPVTKTYQESLYLYSDGIGETIADVEKYIDVSNISRTGVTAAMMYAERRGFEQSSEFQAILQGAAAIEDNKDVESN